MQAGENAKVSQLTRGGGGRHEAVREGAGAPQRPHQGHLLSGVVLEIGICRVNQLGVAQRDRLTAAAAGVGLTVVAHREHLLGHVDEALRVEETMAPVVCAADNHSLHETLSGGIPKLHKGLGVGHGKQDLSAGGGGDGADFGVLWQQEEGGGGRLGRGRQGGAMVSAQRMMQIFSQVSKS